MTHQHRSDWYYVGDSRRNRKAKFKMGGRMMGEGKKGGKEMANYMGVM
jgi:hypothetical protein